MVKLKTVKTSSKSDKKLDVVLETDSGREKTISIGAKGMDDFTKTGDTEQRARYVNRHKHNEDWRLSGILTSGFWARHLLWGPTTSLKQNVEIVKDKFNV